MMWYDPSNVFNEPENIAVQFFVFWRQGYTAIEESREHILLLLLSTWKTSKMQG